MTTNRFKEGKLGQGIEKKKKQKDEDNRKRGWDK